MCNSVGFCSPLISVYKDRLFFFNFYIFTHADLCASVVRVLEMFARMFFYFLARYCVTEMELWKFTKWFLLIVHSWLETGTLVFRTSQGAKVFKLMFSNLCLSARKSSKQRFGTLWVCAPLFGSCWKQLPNYFLIIKGIAQLVKAHLSSLNVAMIPFLVKVQQNS